MATSFNLGGLLGINDGLGDLLTPEQQRAVQQRGLLSAAAALLQAGGRSTTPTSLGQAIGSALLAGQTGAEQAQQSALTQMLTRQKLEEARREAEAAKSFRDLFGVAGVGPAITPAQALAAPGMAAGPTVERAAMIGQPVSSAIPTTGAANILNLLTPEQRQIISTMKPQQGLQEILKISAQAAEFGPEQTVVRNGKPVVIRTNKLGQEQVVSGAAPIESIKFGPATFAVRGDKPVMIRTNQFGEEQIVEGAAPPESLQFGKAEPAVRNGRTVMVQTNPFGEERIVAGAVPYQAPPSDIIATEYIRGSSLAGAGQPGMAAVGQYRQQIAPRTQVDVRLPGNQQFLAGVGGDISKTLSDLTQGARSATETLATIERITPAIDASVIGPAADYRTTMLRIGQQLGVAGQNEIERLANTRTLVQGLAQLELEAASAMRGQGALTEAERGILRRAAAGDQTLSAPELKAALSSAQKVANRRIQTQQEYLRSAMKLPGFEQFAPLYQIFPPSSGAAPNLLNLIEAELQRRQQPPRGR